MAHTLSIPQNTYHDQQRKARYLLLLFIFVLYATGVFAQVPTISSVSPAMGYPASTVTITGTNFNSTPGSNIVYFGATQATVNSGSTTSLNVTVPAGATYAPVSVENGGLVAASGKAFLPTYDNSAYLPGIISLDQGGQLSASSNSATGVLSDIDGDGKPDIIVSNQDANTLSVFRNISSGGTLTASSFAAPLVLTTGAGPNSVVARDLDGDGKPDIAVLNSVDYTVSVYHNTSSPGTLSMDAPVIFAVGTTAQYGLTTADIDGDGKPELIVANIFDANIAILHNTATPGSITSGSFGTPEYFSAGGQMWSIYVGDIDGDGKQDVVTNNFGNTLSVLRNTSSGGAMTFDTPVVVATDNTNYGGVAIGDIDGDGKPDLAIANDSDIGGSTISVLRNTSSAGAVSFAALAIFSTPGNGAPKGIAMGDFDGDGKPDIALVRDYADKMSIFRNTSSIGAVSFDAHVQLQAGAGPSYTYPRDVMIGDLNGDGKPDMVVTDYSDATHLFTNNPVTPFPAITLINPKIDSPGATVTITGTNFNATAANDIVYFGATRATVNIASATSLSVTVPVGATYAPVTVNNTALHRTAYAPYAFLPDYDNSAYTAGTVNFGPHVAFTAEGAEGVAMGDIDGDGKADMVVVTAGDNTASVYLNTSSSGSVTAGSFAAPVSFVVGDFPIALAIGDIDGDGKPDVVALNSSGTISVLRNTSSTGSLSFSAGMAFDVSPYSGLKCIAIGDIDGDGKPDVVIGNASLGVISALRNGSTIGSVAFDQGITLLTGSIYASDVAIIDIDGDGKPDMVTNNYDNTLDVFRNTCSLGFIDASSFAAPVVLATGSNPNKIAAGDIDGDGKPDLAAVNLNDNTVSVFHNTSSPGTISYGAQVTFTTGTSPYAVALGDMDGDGKPDMVVTNADDNTVSVMRNTATSGIINAGSFASQVTFVTDANPYQIAIGDLDGDHKSDIAVISNVHAVSVLRNDPIVLHPTITSVSPAIASPGTTVTITGTNFNTTAANDIVYFGATRATVNTASATSLSVTVPVGATYAPVTVNNTALHLTAYAPYGFLPDYNNSAYLSSIANFDPQVSFATGTTLYDCSIADIDGDGKADIIAVNTYANTVSVFRNTATGGSISAGSFAAPVDFATGNGPWHLAIGDIDGDGKLDIAIANLSDTTVSVLRNTSSSGTISFASQVAVAVGLYPLGLDIGDVDGDGKPELVVGLINTSASTVVLHNTSSTGVITFETGVPFSDGYVPAAVGIRDIDGDGKADLVTVSNYTTSVFLNTSVPGSITAGSFAAPVTSTGTSYADNATIGITDIDGDGKPDIIIPSDGDGTFSIWRNTSSAGSVSFASQMVFAAGDAPYEVAIGDINGDGKPDIALPNFNGANASVFLNTSSGGTVSFAAQEFFAAGTPSDLPFSPYPRAIAIGDMDGDGKSDLVVGNLSGNIAVLRNDPIIPPPTITSVSPAIDSPGTTVTITGTNFNTTAANDIVYFGATRATVNTASATSLSVTVPVGATYAPVTVNNTGLNLTAYAPYAFLPDYNNSAYLPNTIHFDPNVDFASGTQPNSVAISDIDGDGKPDLIVTNNVGTVSVYRNTSSSGSITSGSFAAPINFATGARPYNIATGDIDGDGKPDLAISNISDNTVSVLHNTSSGGSVSFDDQVLFTTDGVPLIVAIQDLDLDGKPDLVVSNFSSGTLLVYQNTATAGSITTGSFASPVRLSISDASAFAIGDIDGDGKPDLAVTRSSTGGSTVSVLLNTSVPGSITTSSFAAPVNYAAGNSTNNIVIADIDGDGKPDIAATNQWDSGDVSVYHNTSSIGTVSLDAQVVFATGYSPGNIAIADIDGDGKPDMTIVNTVWDNSVHIFRNTATSGSITASSFAPPVVYVTGNNANAVAVGDLDGDGKPDMAVVNNDDNTVSVFKNDPLSPVTGPPTITSVSPAIDSPGATVTITGTNFNTTAANDIVYFGATKATVNTASATSLSVTVPVGATYAPVTVNNTGLSLTACAPYAFLPTYDNSAYIPGNVNFDPLVAFATSSAIPLLNTGSIIDMDGDGKPDIVINGSNDFSVYRNTSTSGSITGSSLAAPVTFATGNGPATVVGDIDGDGKPDVVSMNYYDLTLSISLNTSTSGAVSFAPQVVIPANDTAEAHLCPNDFAIRDLDGDGKPDLMILNACSNTVVVYRNTSSVGAASFAPAVLIAADLYPYSIVTGDIDGDGKPDLAIRSGNDPGISILRNTSAPGSISFTAPVDFSAGVGGASQQDMVLSDMDGDGKADLVVTNYNDATTYVYRNTSTPGSITTSSFVAQATFPIFFGFANATSGDMDGDGKPDLVITTNSDSISVFRNTSGSGSISFAPKISFWGGAELLHLAVGDMDGDGKPDIVTADVSDSKIKILRNDPYIIPLSHPTITSVSPRIDSPGATVTITGTNFNATPANNIVYFGATRAAVTSGSTTSLNVTVPFGATYMPVTLNNDSGYTAYAPYMFLPDFNNSAYLPGTVNFDPKVDFATGITPFSGTICDMDGDGKADILIFSFDNTVSIHRNTSSSGSITAGSFAAPLVLATGNGTKNLGIGDVNGDGKPDLAVPDYGGNTISVYINTSSGGSISFAAPLIFPTDNNPSAVAISDIDGDGKPDMAVVNNGLGTVSVWRNISSGSSVSFIPEVTLAAGWGAIIVALNDIDGDGKPDMVVANNGDNTVSAYLNTSSGGLLSFAGQGVFATGNVPSSMTMGDIDGDGKADLMVANSSDGTISAYRNTSSLGTISYAAPVAFSLGAQPWSITMGDMNGDGKPDMVVARVDDNKVGVFRNTSTPGSITAGSFASQVVFSTGTSPLAVMVGDMDGDGKADIIAGNSNDNTISVLRNNPLWLVSGQPTITSVSPAIDSPGATVTISGTNFNTTAANNIVYFGATKATVNTASATSMSVTVPLGATNAPVTENNTAVNLMAYSNQQFLPTYDNSAYMPAAVNFDPKVDFAEPGGGGTGDVVIADIDGDGKPDMVVVGTAILSVYRNASASGSVTSGSFASPVSFVTPADYDWQHVGAGDIDGDGKLDLVIAGNMYGSSGHGSIAVFRNASVSGSVTLDPAASFFAIDYHFPGAVVIADMDGDGKSEVITSGISNFVSVWKNNATPGTITTGSLAASTDFLVGSDDLVGLAIGDLDGDGKPDMAFTDHVNNAWVLRNTSSIGTFSFATPVGFTTGNQCDGLLISDIDGDGKLDLAVANTPDNTISLLRNIATAGTIDAGSFAAQVVFATGAFPVKIASGDFDGDGKPDIAVSDLFAGTVSVFRNTATAGVINTGSLATAVDLATGSGPRSVTVGDMDGDGKADIAVYNQDDVSISVLRNDPLTLVTGPPTITSVSPAIDSPGATVTITGTNFNTTAANDIVYFGATRATVNTASTTSLSVTVPVGATFAPVTVNNANLTAYAPYAFLPDFDNSAYIPGTVNFDALVPFTEDLNSPLDAKIADMDGDGKADMIVVNEGDNTVSVFRNISSGGLITAGAFADPATFSVGNGSWHVVVGDIDGDGKPDMIVMNNADNTVSVLCNTSTSGTISFAARVAFATGAGVGSFTMAIGDLDADGKPDLAISGNDVYVLHNTSSPGSVSFDPYVSYSTGTTTSGIAIGDIDGDSKPDLVAANFGNTFSVLLNTSTSGMSFGASSTFTAGNNNTPMVSVADVDGDGKADVIVTNEADTTISVLRNTSTVGTASFAAQVLLHGNNSMPGIAVGDMNGDGKPDLIIPYLVETSSASAVAVFLNTSSSGTVSFAASKTFTPGSTADVLSPWAVAVGDIDGDGKPDMAVVTSGTNAVAVYRNDPLLPAPTITSVSPNAAAAGASVTITGTRFNTTAANNIVYFGATRATVTGGSSTSLSVTVPAGADYRQVSVNNDSALTAYEHYAFLPQFNNSTYIPGTVHFDPSVEFATPSFSPIVVIQDIDGDGKADMISMNGDNSVSVYRNTSSSGSITTGSFAAPVTFAAGGYASNIITGDVNGDGKPDLIVVHQTDTLYVFRNTSSVGSVSFAPGYTFAMGLAAGFTFGEGDNNIAIGDIDGDGKPDLAITNDLYASLFVLRNLSHGDSIGFEEPLVIANSDAAAVAISDMDGDGKPDVIVAHDGINSVSVYRNISTVGYISTGSFAAPVSFAVGGNGQSSNMLAVGDIDGDGKPDIAVTSQFDNTVSVLRNTSSVGTISCASQIVLTTGQAPMSLAFGDVDGDGKPDMAIANEFDNSFSLFRNTSSAGTISYAAMITYSLTETTVVYPHNMAIGDMDGDGKPDVVIGNLYGPVSVFRNDPLVPPPTITSVSPAIDSPGATVTITGTNFNTTAANDIVYFGATRATVNTASATSLNVTVPVGATFAPVTVNNTGLNLTAYAPYAFLPDFGNSAPGTVNFDPQVAFAAGNGPASVTMGDLDGDGKTDMVVVNEYDNTVSVYLNTSSSGSVTAGSFASPVTYATGNFPTAAAIADIDGDGKLDVVIVNFNDPTFTILRNTSSAGAISFASTTVATGMVDGSGSPIVGDFSIALGDIDGDGKPDMVIGNTSVGALGIIRNGSTSGSIALDPPVLLFMGSISPHGVAIADMDGDGKPDIMAVNSFDNDVFVLRNTSSIGFIDTSSFAAPVILAAGGGPNKIATGDIDGDGKADMVVANIGGNTVSVYHNTSSVGTISYAAQVTFATGVNTFAVAFGDMDGDGKPDLAVLNEGDNTVFVLRNTAVSGTITAGSFATQVVFTTGITPLGLAVGDVDGDKKSDIAVVNADDNTISVLRNDPLTLSGIAPITGNTSICVSSTSTLSDATAGGTWSSTNTSVATVGSDNGIVTGVVAGTTIISYTTGSSAATAIVTINPLPNAGSITGTATVCVGLTTNLTDATSGGVWSSGATGVATVSSTGIVTGVAGGTATISYMVSNGCGSVSATVPVTVNASPVVSAGYNVFIYSGASTPLTAYGASSYSWQPAAGLSATTGVSVTASPTVTTVYTITATVAGCTGSGNVEVFVNTQPALTTGSSCTGAQLSVNSDLQPTQIVWKLNGTPVSTVSPTIATNAVTVAGGAGAGSGANQLNFPEGIYVDDSNNVYVADYNNNRVQKWAPGATSGITVAGGFGAGTAANQLHLPFSVYTDASGNVYVSDDFNSRVQKWARGAASGTTVAGVTGSHGSLATQLNAPAGIYLDKAGNIYIADVANNRIQEWAPGATSGVTVASGYFNQPTGMYLDDTGNVYVANANYHNVLKLAAGSFAMSQVAGSSGPGSGPNDLDYPYGVYVDGKGNIYVADNGNARIQKFAAGTSSGTTVAGITGSPGSGANQLYYPSDVYFDRSGNMYVADGNNSRVQKFAATITTTLTATTTGVYTALITTASGSVITNTVTINSTPSVNSITGTATVCAGSTTNLTDATSGGAWNSGTTGVATVSSTGTVTGVAGGTATISYTVTNSCGTASATKIVTVNPLPNAGSITGTATVCTGATTNLTDAAGGGVWSSGATGVATVSATGTVTGVSAGTAIISYTVTNSCGTVRATATVTVNPSANAGSITGSATVCVSATTNLTDVAGGGAWSSGSGHATVTSTGVVTGVSAGTATISYTVTNSCGSANATTIVTVNALPNAGSITGTATVCVSTTTNLTDATSGGVWSSGATGVATISSTGVVTGVTTGTATISYTVTNSCGGVSTTAVVTVNALPNAGSITGTATVCVSATTNLTDVAGGGAWSSGATGVATVSSTGVVTGGSAGTATISYTVTNGCGGVSTTAVVTVNATSAGTINGLSSVTVGYGITLTDAVGGGAWSASNGNATVSGGVVTGVTVGTVIISYAVTGTCGTAYATKVVTVNAAAIPGITGTTVMCVGVSNTLTDATAGGTWSSSNSLVASVGATSGIVTGVAGGTATISYNIGSSNTAVIVTVNANPLPIQGGTSECVGATILLSDATASGTWSNSNGNASITSGSVTGITAGTNTISYTLPTGCYTTYPNTVLANPVAITGAGFVCVGNTTMLTDATGGATSWTSSNTSVATAINSGQVTGVAAGTAIITYKISSGCITTTIVTVTSTVVPISGNAPVCVGATETLTDASGAGIWSSSNASIASVGSASGVVTGVVNGTVTITYLPGVGGCKATTIATVSVAPAIVGGTSICAGTSTALTDASTGGTWESSNTGVATVGLSSGLVTGVSTGSTVITYTLVSGCTRTTIVNVSGSMTAISGTTSLCASSTTTLSDATAGGTWSISSALIATVGTGGIVTTSSTYTGTATISYSAGGCAATTVITVNANPTPVQGVTSECSGVSVVLSDATAGGVWSVSGNATIGSTGILTAGAAGTATVTYTIGTGCYKTYPNTINANPAPIGGVFTVCAGSSTSLTDATPGGVLWSSSNTAIATNAGPTVTGVAAGTATITYKILTGSCIATQVVTVNAVPIVAAISGPSSISHATPATLSDATPGGVWSSNHTSIIALSGSTGSPVTATAVATSGSAVISYAVTNGAGCTITVTKTITAAPAPHGVSAGVEPAAVLAQEVTLYPNPTNGTINIKADVAGVFYLYSLDGKGIGEYKITEGITGITLPNDLAKGIYMGKYIGEDGNTALFKVVRE